MKNLFRVMIVIIYCVVLAACMNINNDSQNQIPDVQIEKEPNSDEQKENAPDKETNDDKNKEQKPSESESPEAIEKSEVVIQNEAFQIFEPTPNATVKEQIVVRGLARVFEGTVQYHFEDGHFIIDEGFTTATAMADASGWGEFEIIINLDNSTDGPHSIVLFEESAKDGSMINELIIPVNVSK